MSVQSPMNIVWEDDESVDESVKVPKESNSDDFAAMLEQADEDVDSAPVRVGDRISLSVVKISPKSQDVLLEFGTNQAAVIQKMELLGEDGALTVAEGDKIFAFVIGKEGDELLVSQSLSNKVAKEHSLKAAYESKIPVKGKVIAEKKAGFDVMVLGKKAFCPFSQMSLSRGKGQDHVDKEYDFLVQQYHSRNFIVSRTALLQEKSKEMAKAFQVRLLEGEEITAKGRVTDILKFGAVVELENGLSGLVHISELSLKRIKNVNEVVQLGDAITVRVMAVEEDSSKQGYRLNLSFKAMTEDPWEDVQSHLTVGETYSGQVEKLLNMGAIVELKPGLVGMVHISEMSWTKRVNKPEEVLKEGEIISVKVLSIDLEQRRISLSLKDAKDDPYFELEKRYPLESMHTCEVVELKSFGALCQLEVGVVGLLPTGVLKAVFGAAYRKKASPGNKLELQIEAIDMVSRKILLVLPETSVHQQAAVDFQNYLAAEEKKADKRPSSSMNQGVGSFGELLAGKMHKSAKK